MESILLPTTVEVHPGETPEKATLIVEPFFHGYGRTIGNALRRVLLSSLPGAAITSVKIKGVQHEFSPMPGVMEDALEVVLNLKSIRLKLHSEGPVELTLKKKKKGIVTVKDFEPNADVEMLNPNQKIATLAGDKDELELQATVERGRGFSPTEERDHALEIGVISMDALFSPVRNVGFRVEDTRVRDITNYDRLIMEVETDGTLSPEEAIREALDVLLDHYHLLKEKLERQPNAEGMEGEAGS
jgi:DNA-directed RNA polymerase subunit alpha